KVCTDGACAAPACDDRITNGEESDEDCGGPACRGCRDGADCGFAGDCDSSVCAGGLCLAPACDDEAKNGDETDVDCGGSCDRCDVLRRCASDGDCETGKCGVDELCVDPSCTNDTLDATETDTDCGGGRCAPCQPFQSCSVGSDCTSSV